MIYKDEKAVDDTEDYPAPRPGELCNICSSVWDRHSGWACNLLGSISPRPHASYSECVQQGLFHYLTPSMSKSLRISNSAPIVATGAGGGGGSGDPVGGPVLITIFKAAPDPSKDVTTWKDFANKRPGECPCGIKREMCTYHSG